MDKFVTRHRKRSAVEADEWKTEEPFKKYKEECEVEEEFSQPVPWQKIEAEGLDCDYSLLFDKEEADQLFIQLEEEVEYFTGIEDTTFVSCTLLFRRLGSVRFSNVPERNILWSPRLLLFDQNTIKQLYCELFQFNRFVVYFKMF